MVPTGQVGNDSSRPATGGPGDHGGSPMRLTLFIEGGDGVAAPEVELPHITAVMAAFDTCHGGDKWSMTSEVGLHHFTPAHARQLIEMLTPIAAQEVPVEQPA